MGGGVGTKQNRATYLRAVIDTVFYYSIFLCKIHIDTALVPFFAISIRRAKFLRVNERLTLDNPSEKKRDGFC